MTPVLLVLAVLVVGVTIGVAVGRIRGGLDQPVSIRPDVALPVGPLSDTDIAKARFSTGWRGYRMDEVDAVLDRVVEELRERDRLIDDLSTTLASRDLEP